MPGHVWQSSIARESTGIPLIRRVGGGFAAYGEGWGLYAEQLADELGMYESDPLGRIGQREIDRYCVWPGQACSYAIGYAEWVRLREAARRRAGSRFDLRAFHDVLLQGRMPLVVLERVIESTTAVA